MEGRENTDGRRTALEKEKGKGRARGREGGSDWITKKLELPSDLDEVEKFDPPIHPMLTNVCGGGGVLIGGQPESESSELHSKQLCISHKRNPLHIWQ